MRHLLVLMAVAALTSACGKSADQINVNGEGIGPSLVTRTNPEGKVEVAFADRHLLSEDQVISMIDNGQLKFVPIEQVMNNTGTDDDFAIKPTNAVANASADGQLMEAAELNVLDNAYYSRSVTRGNAYTGRYRHREVHRGHHGGHYGYANWRRAARHSRWYGSPYVYAPANYYTSPAWYAPTYLTAPVATYVNNCQQYIAYNSGCYTPYSTSLQVAWNWRLNCNYNNAFVQVYY